jgi:hypothetical protein
MDDLALRTQRLRILLELNAGTHVLGQRGCQEALRAGLARVEPGDIDTLVDMTPDDRALGLACCSLEGELRERQWRALERFLFLAPGADGIEVTRPAGEEEHDDLGSLIDEEFGEVLREALTLGWVRFPSGGLGEPSPRHASWQERGAAVRTRPDPRFSKPEGLRRGENAAATDARQATARWTP